MIVKYVSGKIEAILSKTKKLIVGGVSFCLDEGQSLAIIGETGSGKTTLACSIMNTLPPNVVCSGLSLEFDGKQVKNKEQTQKLLGEQIVYVPQNGHECLSMSRKVMHHVYDSLKKIGVPRCDRYAVAIQKLKGVGLKDPEDVLERYPFELSGGMAQRVVIALATCSNAKLVIADEPTGGLEDVRKGEILLLLNELFPSAALLVITHDISLAKECDEVIVLNQGKVMERGKTSIVLDKPRHPYTKALIDALVQNGMRETPRLREQRGECPFYNRCICASQECLDNIPTKKEDGVTYTCKL